MPVKKLTLLALFTTVSLALAAIELPHVVEQTSQGPGEKGIFPLKEFYGGGHDHKT